MPRHVFYGLLVALCGNAQAADPPPQLEPVPDAAPTLSDEQELTPRVTIIKRERGTIEEYRIRGQLYMIKVIPKKGPAYFLVDTDGDGQLETRNNALDPRFVVPSWMILRW